MMVPCIHIQNQLFTLKSLGTVRELIQDFVNYRVYKTHSHREVLTWCIEHDKGVLLLLQGLPEVFSS